MTTSTITRTNGYRHDSDRICKRSVCNPDNCDLIHGHHHAVDYVEECYGADCQNTNIVVECLFMGHTIICSCGDDWRNCACCETCEREHAEYLKLTQQQNDLQLLEALGGDHEKVEKMQILACLIDAAILDDEGNEQIRIEKYGTDQELSDVTARYLPELLPETPDDDPDVFEEGFLESALGWKLEYDEIEKSEVVTGLDGIKPRGTWNATEFQVMHDAARAQFKSKMGKETFQRMLSVACYKNRFHRIRDHIETLPTWNGVKRIDRIMADGWGMKYAADDNEIREIHSLYLHHFFVGAIRKVATPERKHHQVLTLTGEGGGQGKSTFAEIIGYDDLGMYADIGFPPDSKTVIEWTRGSWIVEISELAGSQRQNWDVINHVLSTNRDVARLAYDRNTTSRDREFVFIASTNNLGFIRGRDGIRRWNPIDVTSRSLNKRWLRDNRDQIWAEAKHYADDPKWQSFVDRDDPAVFARMNAYVESYVEVIPEVSIVEAAIRDLGDTLQLSELRKMPDLADIKPSLITASLKRIGFRSRVVRLDDGRQVRAWVKA